MEKSLGETVTNSLPWPPSPTPTDLLRLGAPLRLGSAWTTFWPPLGCACPGLPANSCLPTRCLNGPLWTGGCGGRKSPPPPNPQTSQTPAQGLASLCLDRKFVFCALQLEPWTGGHQLRHPVMGFRGPGLGQPFWALQTTATSWPSQCGAAFFGL